MTYVAVVPHIRECRRFLPIELRSRKWHYLWFEPAHREELYDLSRDPEESHDVAASQPERVTDFRAEIERWKQTVAQPFSVAEH